MVFSFGAVHISKEFIIDKMYNLGNLNPALVDIDKRNYKK